MHYTIEDLKWDSTAVPIILNFNRIAHENERFQIFVGLKVLLEALFVGSYSAILGFLVSGVRIVHQLPRMFQYFLVGFLKHFFAYWLGIHTLYCQFGVACDGKNVLIARKRGFVIDSLFEGFFFGLMSFLFMPFSLTTGCAMIGILLHLSFEIFGMHKKWCLANCGGGGGGGHHQ
jgi:hypothetical protein